METWGVTIGSLQFNIVDVIIISLLFLSAVLGAFKGFANEFASRFGFIIAVFVSALFNALVGRLIFQTFAPPLLWSSFLAFMAVFLVVYFVMLSLGNGLESLLTAMHLGWLDTILGLVLGAVQMALLITVVIYILSLQNILDLGTYFDSSELYTRYIIRVIEAGVESMNQAVSHV